MCFVSSNWTSSTEGSGGGGFIHLFLPLSSVASGPEVVSPSTTTTTTAAPPTMAATRRHQDKRKKKKKKKKTTTRVEAVPIHQQRRRDEAEQQPPHLKMSNRLDVSNLGAESDAMPPLFNSLSTDETQQWARWLRCTLCLKVSPSCPSLRKNVDATFSICRCSFVLSLSGERISSKKSSAGLLGTRNFLSISTFSFQEDHKEGSALCQHHNVDCVANGNSTGEENELTTSGCQGIENQSPLSFPLFQ